MGGIRFVRWAWNDIDILGSIIPSVGEKEMYEMLSWPKDVGISPMAWWLSPKIP